MRKAGRMLDRRMKNGENLDKTIQERRRLERREYVRVPESLQIIYETISGEKIEEHLTRDISQGGLRFSTRECIPRDSYLKIRLIFSKSLFSFEALAKCMWVREIPYGEEFEIGVEFIDLPPEILKYLIGYIEDIISIRDK